MNKPNIDNYTNAQQFIIDQCKYLINAGIYKSWSSIIEVVHRNMYPEYCLNYVCEMFFNELIGVDNISTQAYPIYFKILKLSPIDHCKFMAFSADTISHDIIENRPNIKDYNADTYQFLLDMFRYHTGFDSLYIEEFGSEINNNTKSDNLITGYRFFIDSDFQTTTIEQNEKIKVLLIKHFNIKIN